MRVHVCILFFLFSGAFSFSQKPQKGYIEDSIQLNKLLKKIDSTYYSGQFDSTLYYLKECYGKVRQKKHPYYLSKFFLYYGLYYRNHTLYNFKKALVMYEKSLYWAKKENNLELIERINYSKLTVYLDIFNNSSTKLNQSNLVKQVYENIFFSELTKSKVHLYKSIDLLKDVYFRYNQDSIYYSSFDKYFRTSPLSPESINYQVFYFGYYLHNKDFKNAVKCFESLNKLYKNREISELVYSYYINIFMNESLNNTYISNLVSKKLKPRLKFLPGPSDSLTYYINFTRLYINLNEIEKANYYLKLTENHLKTRKDIPISFQFAHFKNKQKLFEANENFTESAKVYEKIILISQNMQKDFDKLNLSIVQEKISNDIRIKKSQQAILNKKRESELQLAQKNNEIKSQAIVAALMALIISIISFQFFRYRSQNQKLKTLTTFQSESLGVLNRDLYIPVRDIYNKIIELLSLEQLTSDKVRHNTKIILANLTNLLLSLDSLLYWPHSQQNSFQINPVDCQLIDILEEVVELLEPIISINDIKISNHIDPSHECRFDDTHLRIIIQILTHHILLNTPKGGTIIFSSLKDTTLTSLIIKNEQNTEENKKIASNINGIGVEVAKNLLDINKGKMKSNDSLKQTEFVLTFY